MSVIDWVKEKLGMQSVPTFGPPSYAAPPIVRVPIAAATPSSDNPSASEPASLVSSSSHKKGVSSDNRSSLIDGR